MTQKDGEMTLKLRNISSPCPTDLKSTGLLCKQMC